MTSFFTDFWSSGPVRTTRAECMMRSARVNSLGDWFYSSSSNSGIHGMAFDGLEDGSSGNVPLWYSIKLQHLSPSKSSPASFRMGLVPLATSQTSGIPSPSVSVMVGSVPAMVCDIRQPVAPHSPVLTNAITKWPRGAAGEAKSQPEQRSFLMIYPGVRFFRFIESPPCPFGQLGLAYRMDQLLGSRSGQR